MAPKKTDEPPSDEPKLETVQVDARFPNQNQTIHCYTMYCDFHRCSILLGDGYEPCQYFKKVFTTICPNAWIEKWDQQRADGVFPATMPCRRE